MKFKFNAFDNTGKKISDSIDAGDINNAKSIIKNRKLHLIEITEVKDSINVKSDKKTIAKKNIKLKDKELITFCHQMWLLLKSGFQINEALEQITGLGLAKNTNDLILFIKNKVQSGSSLSEAIDVTGASFPGYFSDIIRGGEATGNIDSIFKQLYTITSNEYKLKKKIISFLTYPAFLIVFSIVVTVVLLGLVVPTITTIFETAEAELPLVTKILIKLSEFISNNWYYLIIFVLLAIFIIEKILKIEKVKFKISYYKLKCPVIKNLYTKILIVKFSQTLSVLLKNRVNILKALLISANVTEFNYFKFKINEIINSVKSGVDLSSSLNNLKLFPDIFIKTVSIGEKSNELDTVFENIYDIYNDELQNQISNMLSIIEPVAMLVVASIVGFIAFSIILPIIRMNTVLM